MMSTENMHNENYEKHRSTSGIIIHHPRALAIMLETLEFYSSTNV
jgi:hypothetical protein